MIVWVLYAYLDVLKSIKYIYPFLSIIKLLGLNSLEMIERLENVSNNRIIYETKNYAFSLSNNPLSWR